MLLGGSLVSLAAMVAQAVAPPAASPPSPAPATSAAPTDTDAPGVPQGAAPHAMKTPPPMGEVPGAGMPPQAIGVTSAQTGAMAPPPLLDPNADPALANAPPVAADDALIDGRRRPGAIITLPDKVTQDNPGAVRAPPPEAFPTDQIPLPDRWRLARTLCPDTNYVAIQAVCHGKFDPYHQNALKGDRPARCQQAAELASLQAARQ